MDTRALLILAAAALALAVWVGGNQTIAAEKATSGNAVYNAPASAIGQRLLDIEFAAPDGSVRKVSSYFDDATIVAMINEPCAGRESPLAKAGEIATGGVAIVEISTAGPDCTAHAQCVAARGIESGHLVSVCDPRGVVRGLLGATAPNNLLLLDNQGTVVDQGGLADFDRLYMKAAQMARAADRDRWALLH